MYDGQQSKKEMPWQLYVVLGLIIVLMVAFVGNWWIQRPERSMQHFIALLSKGQINEAAEMLLEGSTLQMESNGIITLKAADGMTATLTEGEYGESRFNLLIIPGTSHRNGLGDYLAGRSRFYITPVLSDAETPWTRSSRSGTKSRLVRRPRIKIRCVAEGSRIVLETIE